MPRFVQTFPPLPDVYEGDHVLQRSLDRHLGEVGHKTARPALEALAADVAGPLRAAHADAESHPPVLRQYDGWGRRVDEIETAQGWDTLRQASARHGLVALPYEESARTTYGAGARVVHLALLHLYSPESATYSCPVAMSDGAAAVLGAPGIDPGVRDVVLPRLLSRDPDVAWTSGQWMTETEGGSDVGRGSTAAAQDGGTWRLTGEKWFCSATTSEVSIALARPEGRERGSKGLSCFLIPRYADVADIIAGRPLRGHETAPGLRLHRLKDKLGTRALPSAEVGLEGAEAFPLGDPAVPGLSRMMQLVQITRLHNAAAAAASMRRGLMLVRNHAAAREAFGAKLDQQPLHRETLAWLAVDAEAAFAMTAAAWAHLGRVEVDGDAASARVLRLSATLVKALTGKLAVASASEYVECFGGAGFIEDTGVPRLLRDTQVLPIWEGTTNVLSLDVLRALVRDDVLEPYADSVSAAADAARDSGDPWLSPVAADVAAALTRVTERAAAAAGASDAASLAAAQAGARALMWDLACVQAAAALLDQAAYDVARGDTRSALVASLWVRRRVVGDPATGDGHRGFAHVVDGAPL